MRIANIEFERCNEYDESAWYVVPDHIATEDEVHKIVQTARDEYLAAALAFHKSIDPGSGPVIQIEQVSDDSKTVGELKAAIAAHKLRVAEHQKLAEVRTGAFEDVLVRYGFVKLWKYKGDDVIKCVVDFGHNHGVRLEY